MHQCSTGKRGQQQASEAPKNGPPKCLCRTPPLPSSNVSVAHHLCHLPIFSVARVSLILLVSWLVSCTTSEIACHGIDRLHHVGIRVFLLLPPQRVLLFCLCGPIVCVCKQHDMTHWRTPADQCCYTCPLLRSFVFCVCRFSMCVSSMTSHTGALAAIIIITVIAFIIALVAVVIIITGVSTLRR